MPSASYLLSGISKGATAGHVFNNPYKEAENAKIASLEKHVKMVRVNRLVYYIPPFNKSNFKPEKI